MLDRLNHLKLLKDLVAVPLVELTTRSLVEILTKDKANNISTPNKEVSRVQAMT